MVDSWARLVPETLQRTGACLRANMRKARHQPGPTYTNYNTTNITAADINYNIQPGVSHKSCRPFGRIQQLHRIERPPTTIQPLTTRQPIATNPIRHLLTRHRNIRLATQPHRSLRRRHPQRPINPGHINWTQPIAFASGCLDRAHAPCASAVLAGRLFLTCHSGHLM